MTTTNSWRARYRVVDRIILLIASAFMFVMVVATMMNVLGRYIFDSPILLAGQLAVFLFIWQVFLAAGSAMGKGLHVAVDVLVDILPSRARAWVDLVAGLSVLLTIGAATYWGMLYAVNRGDRVLQILGVPYRYMYLAVPVGFLLMAVPMVERIGWAVRGTMSGDYQPPRSTARELADAEQKLNPKAREPGETARTESPDSASSC